MIELIDLPKELLHSEILVYLSVRDITCISMCNHQTQQFVDVTNPDGVIARKLDDICGPRMRDNDGTLLSRVASSPQLAGILNSIAQGCISLGLLHFVESQYLHRTRHRGRERFSCGSYHSAYVDPVGSLFTFGSRDGGCLGDGKDTGYVSIPVRSSAFEKINCAYVSAGEMQTAVMDKNGTVYAMGGLLTSATPVQVELGENEYAVQLSCSSYNLAILCGSGKVFLLDQSMARKQTIPPLPTNEHVVHIACGYRLLFMVTDAGKVYIYPLSRHSGIEQTNTQSISQMEGLGGYRVVHVAAGTHHVAILTDNGKLLTMGYGGNGRLGHGNEDSCFTPKIVEGLRDQIIVQASCGEHHTAVATVKGDIYTFGYGAHGRLGYSTRHDVMKPTKISLPDRIGGVLAVSCGRSHTAILTDREKIYTCGYGFHGRLGHSKFGRDLSCKTFHLVDFEAPHLDMEEIMQANQLELEQARAFRKNNVLRLFLRLMKNLAKCWFHAKKSILCMVVLLTLLINRKRVKQYSSRVKV